MLRRWPARLLLCTVLAGCGGSATTRDQAAKRGLVPAIVATNLPGTRVVGVRPTGGPRNGVVQGGPSLDVLTQVHEPQPQAVAEGAASCGNVDALPNASNLSEQGRTIVCLVNAERKARGLAPLRMNGLLSRASRDHSTDMVAHRYFAHDTRNGRPFTDRLRAVRYVRPSSTWTVGENLAWGSGSLASPRALIDGWMASPEHKANILQPRYREVGIGIVLGKPTAAGGDPSVTVTTDFGQVA